MRGLFKGLAVLFACFWLTLVPALKAEAQGITILRDAETEWFLRELSAPFFRAAGLSPDAVSIYIVYDPTMNAFVAGGQNVFVFSGMIQAVDNVNQLEGVIAHETGHISGGHLARFSEGTKAPIAILIASMLLGLGAAAAGSPDAAAGLMLGGQTMAQRAFLSYTRVQESAADQAALTFLEKTGTSAQGLIEFFDKIRDQELITVARRDPYVRTHPLSGDRILRLQTRARNSPYWDAGSEPEKSYWFKRVRAKIDGYISRPDVTLREYPPYDKSEFARYARVYAYQKDLQWDQAMAEVNSLLEDHPDDPYYLETAGQILFERGKAEESIPYLRRAAELKPNEPLILTLLANSLVALETPEADQEASQILKQALAHDRRNDLAWRQLSVVYARLGQTSLAELATAELFMLQGRYPAALKRARGVMKNFDHGSREWLQAQDIIVTARSLMAKDDRFKDYDPDKDPAR